jgi:2'-5' RNA ligase
MPLRRARRTALIVEVPEAEPHVAELRAQYDWSAQRGVPAHVTILFPFAPAHDVDEPAVRRLFADFTPFEFVLDRVERWDAGIVWLHPEPSQPFSELTRAVWERWPGYPPYEGIHEEVIPHLTVSETLIDVHIEVPIACRAKEVTLIEEGDDEMWTLRRRFPLGEELRG